MTAEAAPAFSAALRRHHFLREADFVMPPRISAAYRQRLSPLISAKWRRRPCSTKCVHAAPASIGERSATRRSAITSCSAEHRRKLLAWQGDAWAVLGRAKAARHERRELHRQHVAFEAGGEMTRAVARVKAIKRPSIAAPPTPAIKRNLRPPTRISKGISIAVEKHHASRSISWRARHNRPASRARANGRLGVVEAGSARARNV